MPHFKVSGTIPIAVSIEVEAETPEEAKQNAWCDMPIILASHGNSKIGIEVGSRAFISPIDDAEPDFTTVEPL